MDQLRVTILQIIAARDGKYSWYQLERALGQRGVVPEGNLMDVLRDLEQQVFISSSPQVGLPSQPLLFITEQGRQLLSRVA